MLLELILNKTHNMISIIIPIYNVEKYLNDCLKSVQQQTYSDFEALMVDDGSKDGSAEICLSYENNDSRFHYIHQENAGVSVARNTGLSRAKGEWISFVDADDAIDKNFLQEMLGQSEVYDAVNCDYTTDLKNLGKGGGMHTISKEDLIKSIIYDKSKTPQLWSLIYRKSIIDKRGLKFTPGCIRNEDYEFFMKYLAACEKPIALKKHIGYYYRLNPSSVMHQLRSRKSVLMSLEATKNVEKTLENIGLIPQDSRLTAFSITTFLYIMSREKNHDMYEELHSLFPIKKHTKTSLRYGSTRVKGAAFLYLVLGRRLFYRAISLLVSP